MFRFIFIHVVRYLRNFGSTCQTEYSLMPTSLSKVTAAFSAREGRGQ